MVRSVDEVFVKTVRGKTPEREDFKTTMAETEWTIKSLMPTYIDDESLGAHHPVDFTTPKTKQLLRIKGTAQEDDNDFGESFTINQEEPR